MFMAFTLKKVAYSHLIPEPHVTEQSDQSETIQSGGHDSVRQAFLLSGGLSVVAHLLKSI